MRSWLGVEAVSTTVLLIVLAYGLGVIVVRWHMIARPLRSQLDAQRDTIRAELAANRIEGHGKIVSAIRGLLSFDIPESGATGTPRNTSDASETWERTSLLDRIFWSRGREAALWIRIDKAMMLLVELWPIERVLARLKAASASGQGDVRTQALAAHIAEELNRSPKERDELHKNAGDAYLRALLQEQLWAEREALQVEDIESDHYSNKLMWYIAISLLAICLIGTVGRQIFDGLAYPVGQRGTIPEPGPSLLFLLAGGIGGVLSRLAAAVWVPNSQEQATTAQRLRWMVLFLSPLVGALAGWAGMFVILTGISVNLFSAELGKIMSTPAVVGLAMILGFSERLFMSVAQTLADRVSAPPSAKELSSVPDLHSGSRLLLGPVGVPTSPPSPAPASGGGSPSVPLSSPPLTTPPPPH